MQLASDQSSHLIDNVIWSPTSMSSQFVVSAQLSSPTMNSSSNRWKDVAWHDMKWEFRKRKFPSAEDFQEKTLWWKEAGGLTATYISSWRVGTVYCSCCVLPFTPLHLLQHKTRQPTDTSFTSCLKQTGRETLSYPVTKAPTGKCIWMLSVFAKVCIEGLFQGSEWQFARPKR